MKAEIGDMYELRTNSALPVTVYEIISNDGKLKVIAPPTLVNIEVTGKWSLEDMLILGYTLVKKPPSLVQNLKRLKEA